MMRKMEDVKEDPNWTSKGWKTVSETKNTWGRITRILDTTKEKTSELEQ